MNWAVLRSFGFIVTFITTVAGLLIAQGAIVDGSAVDTVVGWILAILGAIGGHQISARPPKSV